MPTIAKRTTKKSTSKKSSQEIQSALLDFFIDEIKDIYWAEKHLVSALPKMKKAASSEELNASSEEISTTVANLSSIVKEMSEKLDTLKI